MVAGSILCDALTSYFEVHSGNVGDSVASIEATWTWRLRWPAERLIASLSSQDGCWLDLCDDCLPAFWPGAIIALVLPAFQFPSWYNRMGGAHPGRAVLPAFQFPSWYNQFPRLPPSRLVLPAFQFPSWYNCVLACEHSLCVLPAFQFPSWYNAQRGVGRRRRVLPAFQFPSWYN